MEVTALDEAASGCSSCHVFFSSSKRETLSGVKSHQRKSGGFGNVDEMVGAWCIAWSAMSAPVSRRSVAKCCC